MSPLGSADVSCSNSRVRWSSVSRSAARSSRRRLIHSGSVLRPRRSAMRLGGAATHRRRPSRWPFDQVEPIDDQLRVRQRLPGGLGVGRRHVDRHELDRRLFHARSRLSSQSVTGLRGAAVDLHQQPAASPVMSTSPVSQRSTHRAAAGVGEQVSHLAFPRRVSSMPSTATASGSAASTGSAVAFTASWQVFQLQPYAAATALDRAVVVEHRQRHLRLARVPSPAPAAGPTAPTR